MHPVLVWRNFRYTANGVPWVWLLRHNKICAPLLQNAQYVTEVLKFSTHARNSTILTAILHVFCHWLFWAGNTSNYSTASACFKCWLVKSPSRDTRYFLQRPVMTFCRSLFDWADRSLFTRARPMDSVLQTRLTRAESASAQLAARVS